MPEAFLQDTAIVVPPDALVAQATHDDPQDLLSLPRTSLRILRAIDYTDAQATQMLFEEPNPEEVNALGLLTADSGPAEDRDKAFPPSRPGRTHKLLAYCRVIHRSTPLPFLREAED